MLKLKHKPIVGDYLADLAPARDQTCNSRSPASAASATY
jgi:hypothetical protein